MLRIAAIILMTSLLSLAASETDPFDQIKTELSDAACNHIRFLSVVHSDVFESVDTVAGQAYVAQDGRYAITLGPDTYVQTKDRLYSYSESQNQVTVELSDVSNATHGEVSFLNRLDDYYHARPVIKGYDYSLTLLDTTVGLPDSMHVVLDSTSTMITSMRYLDSNGDLNEIVVLSLDALNRCDSLSLRPSFPDTVEMIGLY